MITRSAPEARTKGGVEALKRSEYLLHASLPETKALFSVSSWVAQESEGDGLFGAEGDQICLSEVIMIRVEEFEAFVPVLVCEQKLVDDILYLFSLACGRIPSPVSFKQMDLCRSLERKRR